MPLPGVWFGSVFYGRNGSCYRVDRAIRGASIADLRDGRVTDKAGFSVKVVARLRDLPTHAHGSVHGDTFTATSGRQYRLGAGYFSRHRDSAFIDQGYVLTWTGRMLGIRRVGASFGAALPAGPFNTPAAAQAWLVWLFEERAARHPELAGRLKASAAVLRSRSYRATWEAYADGIREAIRIQAQPVAGNLVAGIDGFAKQNGMPGWLGAVAWKPLPSMAFVQLRVAAWCALDGQNSQNPDVTDHPELSAPLTALAFKIVNASGFRDDRPDNYSGVANLCNWILSELPRGAIRTAHFVENMRAMAVGAKPRTMDELAKQLWQQTADALRDGTAAVAKAAGETIKKAKESFDEGAGEGTSTALMVGLGLLGVVGAGVVVWKVAK